LIDKFNKWPLTGPFYYQECAILIEMALTIIKGMSLEEKRKIEK